MGTILGNSNPSEVNVSCHRMAALLAGPSRNQVLLKRIDCDDRHPSLSLVLRSSINASTGGKHLHVDVRIRSILASVTSDFAFANDLAEMLKAPPDAFVDVEPGELTKINLQVSDSVVRILPMKLSSALIIPLMDVRWSTTLQPAQPALPCQLGLGLTEVWISDNAAEIESFRSRFKSLGYAHLARLAGCTGQMRQSIDSKPAIFINIVHATVGLTACPDTLLVLGLLLSDFAPPQQPKPKKEQQPIPDMSGSVVMQRPSGEHNLHSPLGSSYKPPRRADSRVIVADGEVQISTRGKGKIRIAEDWFLRDAQASKASSSRLLPSVHLTLENSSATICLYEGYDFDATRKHIKQTVKATRKRLEKIRQLLAEGQIPEETVDEAADYLLQSVFLPSRTSADENASGAQMDTVDRIVAFDDELDEEELDTDSQDWEELPGRPATMRRTFSSGSAQSHRRRAGRLHRPKQSALDVHLDGLKVDLNTFEGSVGLASRAKIDIADLSIVDNLRSSTWHKFLTELRPRDGGLLRPTGAPMVQVLLRMYRTESCESEEANLKMKISPLRLHVDQDALDFLKAFAAFKMQDKQDKEIPSLSKQQVEEAQDESGGFVQRVEIFPIKIKLDYKPKRVDYRALQRGQTIEMMNFFHFEASEMTLRHLVLNGVPSWAKVGDMCQDIWTPDVKSHQLADFLAGINPVRSVVNLGTGVAELVLLPVQQYQKDGRLSRGVQKGTTKFAKTTALEAVKLGARLASGTQVILEKAEHMLGARSASSSSSHPPSDLLVEATAIVDELGADDYDESDRKDALSKFSHQPKNAKEGLQSAYKSLSGNVRSAAETILAVPIEVYERSNEVSIAQRLRVHS